ncbi:hypothetical protein ACH5RR_012934 [Cinchona calisaya]|uniref:Uncharacterized protein n=1 Tax=Cinchona calisaya TaxID=153742 RepID=A0ABD2ZYR5_9GENT
MEDMDSNRMKPQEKGFCISTSVLRELRISIYFDCLPDDMHTNLVLGYLKISGFLSFAPSFLARETNVARSPSGQQTIEVDKVHIEEPTPSKQGEAEVAATFALFSTSLYCFLITDPMLRLAASTDALFLETYLSYQGSTDGTGSPCASDRDRDSKLPSE